MFGSKKETQAKNPNVLEFSKTKGVGSINYGAVITKATFGETALTVERINKVFLSKASQKLTLLTTSQSKRWKQRYTFQKAI